ncbi:MAG TPA: STAS domain-containing protein [Verrucomicrobiae bacterium]|jgi:anti-anti-sigma factor
MEIQKVKNGDQLEFKLQGRLDAYWSDHLSASIEESIHSGWHKIQLNLAQVDYLSSAGIRVLLKFYKQLSAIKGSLSVIQPSESARAILTMAGLAQVLIRDSATSAVAPARVAAGPVRMEKGIGIYNIHEIAPGATLKCTFVGDPGKLESGAFTSCENIQFPESTFGLGLGAFGSDFADASERFGEFLALAGTAIYLPTNGTSVPDFMISEDAFVPEMKALYALAGKGQFAKMIRFDAKSEPPGVIPLSDLAEMALDACNSDLVGFAMIAESAGLVGAALRQSPVKSAAGESRLNFPAIRDWLSFTGERTFDRTVCLVVGVVSRQEVAQLKSILRPVGNGIMTNGHFHAAVFPYRPLQRGELDLTATVNELFATDRAQSILHLLPDDRDLVGSGQSEFLRGALWVGPISDLTGKL